MSVLRKMYDWLSKIIMRDPVQKLLCVKVVDFPKAYVRLAGLFEID